MSVTNRSKSALFLLFLLGLVAAGGCRSIQSTTEVSTAAPAQTATPTPGFTSTLTPAVPATVTRTPAAQQPSPAPKETDSDSGSPLSFGYTHQRSDGNRLVSGRGNLPEVEPVEVPLAREPRWVVAAPVDGGAVWAAVLANQRVQAFQSRGKEITEISIEPAQLLPGLPPLLKIEGERPTLLNAPVDAPSPLTPPVELDNGQRLAFVHAGGDVMFWDGAEPITLEVNALPDARILVDEAERLLLLTDPTDRYGHGVLGDDLEAAGITLIETNPTPRVALTIAIPEPSVIEQIAPIWTDLTGDGRREIIVTVSNAEQGAQLVVFNEAGEQIAAGPAIGRGFRWRHQLAAAPFGPNGELELVDVLTPHIGGTVEFYRLEEDQLPVVASVPGYTSHVIGARNLDMAMAGDFDGDGRVELLLPNQARTELGAIRRTENGAGVAWTLPVDGVVSTNLAGVTLADGNMAIGVGRDDGTLRLWLPE